MSTPCHTSGTGKVTPTLKEESAKTWVPRPREVTSPTKYMSVAVQRMVLEGGFDLVPNAEFREDVVNGFIILVTLRDLREGERIMVADTPLASQSSLTCFYILPPL